MLKIKNLKKSFKSTIACKNIDFSVESGEFFVLLGPSGCGKTTILRLIAGLEKPDEGGVFFNDKNLGDISVQERNTALVFQNYALYPNMSVRGNLTFPLKMRKISKTKTKDTVEKIASMLKIKNLLDKKAVKLSGGQQQRVAVGRALVRKPEIFLLDEPLSNLDAKLRQHLRMELIKIHKEMNITTLYVTHDQNEAMTLGDRIAVLRDGNIHQIGTPEEIYSSPVNLFVAKFIGFPEINLFKTKYKPEKGAVNILGKELQLFEKGTELPDNTENVTAAVRPEDIHISSNNDDIEGNIEVKEVSGPDTVLYLNVDGYPVRMRVAKDKKGLLEKIKTNIKIEPEKVLLFNSKTERIIKNENIRTI